MFVDTTAERKLCSKQKLMILTYFFSKIVFKTFMIFLRVNIIARGDKLTTPQLHECIITYIILHTLLKTDQSTSSET